MKLSAVKVIPEAVNLPSGYPMDNALARRFRFAFMCKKQQDANVPGFVYVRPGFDVGPPLIADTFVLGVGTEDVITYYSGPLMIYESDSGTHRVEFSGVESPMEFIRHRGTYPAESFSYLWSINLSDHRDFVRPSLYQTEVTRRLSPKTFDVLVDTFGASFRFWLDQQQEYELKLSPTLDVGTRVFARPDARQQSLEFRV